MHDDYRYEIKYEIEPRDAHSIQEVIFMHPLGFKKAFPDRWVNNIYFDTPGYVTCQENLDGISDRKKFRLRWYGDIRPLRSPKFEIKIKTNMVGRKESMAMPEHLSMAELSNILQTSGKTPEGMRPVIQNRYLRSYYINMEGNFRITVDRHLQHTAFHDLSLEPKTQLRSFDQIIMELKFDVAAVPLHKDVTRYIPYRQTKHSKYVSAVMACLAYV